MKSNLIDIEVCVWHETEKAILVSEDEDSERVWLPLSQIEVDHGTSQGYATITLPEHLALDKNLI